MNKPLEQKALVTGVIILIILVINSNTPVKAAYKFAEAGDTIWGIKGGYSQVKGYYSNDLRDSPYLGFYLIPYVGRYLLGEIDLSFTRYSMAGSEKSALYSFTLGAGPLIYYPLLDFLQPYAGFSLKGSYLYLDTDKLGKKESTIKPGFILKAGFSIPFSNGVSSRLGIEYSQNQLSEKQFKTLSIFAGAALNINKFYNLQKDDEKRELKDFYQVEKYYKSGVTEFNSRNLERAKKYFNKALSINSKHKESLEYIAVIEKAEKAYSDALNLIERKKYFESIPLLIEASRNMENAEEKLREVRILLSGEVALLEKQGIEAYESKDYQKCIFIMKRIIIIQPENSTARIYLPRAVKRYEALQKLR